MSVFLFAQGLCRDINGIELTPDIVKRCHQNLDIAQHSGDLFDSHFNLYLTYLYIAGRRRFGYYSCHRILQ